MIITIAHHRGGVGKTTLALNLAATLKPDIIIDLDMHDTLTTLNQFRETPLPLVHCDSNNLLEVLNQEKLILIDCGGYDGEIIQKAIALSDLVIVPVNDEINELIGLAKFDHLLAELSGQINAPINAFILPYRIHHATKQVQGLVDFAAQSQSFRKLESIIRTRKTYANASSFGCGVVEHPSTKYSDAAKEMKRLAQELNTLIN